MASQFETKIHVTVLRIKSKKLIHWLIRSSDTMCWQLKLVCPLKYIEFLSLTFTKDYMVFI